VWAATVLLGPLAAGLAAGRLSAQAVFGLTAVACLAMLAVTFLVAGRMRRPARAACAPGDDFVPGDDLIPGREQLPGRSGRRNG
jgi:predicted lipid-binding transport protein (Tim44 family)